MVKVTLPSIPLTSLPQSDVSYFLNQSECGRFLYWIVQFKLLVVYDMFMDQQTQIPIKDSRRILSKPQFLYGTVVKNHLCVVSQNLKGSEAFNFYTLSVFQFDKCKSKLVDRDYFAATRFSMFASRSIFQSGDFSIINYHKNNMLCFQLRNAFRLSEPKHDFIVDGVEFRHEADAFSIDWNMKTAYVFTFHNNAHNFHVIDLKANQKVCQNFKVIGEAPPREKLDGPQIWQNGCLYYSKVEQNAIVYLSKFDPYTMIWEQIEFDDDRSSNVVNFTVTSSSTLIMIERKTDSHNRQRFESHRISFRNPETLNHLAHCTAKHTHPALLQMSKEKQAQFKFLPAYKLEFKNRSFSLTEEANYFKIVYLLIATVFSFWFTFVLIN